VPRHARYEAGSVHLRCQTPGGGDCEVYQDPDQGGGGGWVLQPRDRVRFTFPGYAFRVVGVGGLPPGAEIDGRALALKESGASGNLEQGWHDVELVAGERFHLDRIEVFGEGEPLLPQTRLASIGGCGCASGRAGGSAGGALALAALLAGLVRRRRR
jgi:MYXO-CTERM domain-containing protein